MAIRSVRVVGAHEIRMLIGDGISRQRVYQILKRSDFPKPYAELMQGKLWLTDDVEEWISTHRRKRTADVAR